MIPDVISCTLGGLLLQELTNLILLRQVFALVQIKAASSHQLAAMSALG